MTVLVLLLLVAACAAQMRLNNLTNIVFLMRPFFATLGLDEVDVGRLDVACPAQDPQFFWCDANGTITINVTSTGASGDVALGFFLGQPIRRIFAANNAIQNVTFSSMVTNLLATSLGKTLSEVDLSSNNISTWPVEFDALPFTHFKISRNRLDGPVPDLKNWSKIVECTLMDAENETNTLCSPTCNPQPAVCFRNVPLCAGVVCGAATSTTPLSNVTLATTSLSNVTLATTAVSDPKTTTTTPTTTTTTPTMTTPTITMQTMSAAISRTTEGVVKPIIDDSDTFPLIIGLSIGAAFAAIVIGIALACVFREKKKNKQLEVAYSPPLATSLQAGTQSGTQSVSEGTEFAKPNKVVAVYDVVSELLPAESHYTRAPSPGPDIAVSPTGDYGRAPVFPSSSDAPS